MTVTAQYAQEHLPELLDSAERGEEIEVSRDGKPSIKLLVIPRPPTPPTGPVILGAGRRKMEVASEGGGTATGRTLGAGRGTFLASVDADWDRLKQEDEARTRDAPLVTTGEV